MEYDIKYPSGKRFTLEGKDFVVIPDTEHGTVAVIEGIDDTNYVLDPRAIVRTNGKVIYRGPKKLPNEVV